MNKHPIVVLISGNGSNLQAIIDKSKYTDIVAVASDKTSAHGLKRASDANIFNFAVQRRINNTREEYCERLAGYIADFNPELIVLAGFMKILTPNFFERFHEKQIVNIHPSILPAHKGLNTHQRVLDAGDKEHGMTIHYVTEELDSGPIIWQSQFFIQPNDTAETLEEKVHKLEHQWYPWVIDQVVRGNM